MLINCLILFITLKKSETIGLKIKCVNYIVLGYESLILYDLYSNIKNNKGVDNSF